MRLFEAVITLAFIVVFAPQALLFGAFFKEITPTNIILGVIVLGVALAVVSPLGSFSFFMFFGVILISFVAGLYIAQKYGPFE